VGRKGAKLGKKKNHLSGVWGWGNQKWGRGNEKRQGKKFGVVGTGMSGLIHDDAGGKRKLSGGKEGKNRDGENGGKERCGQRNPVALLQKKGC